MSRANRLLALAAFLEGRRVPVSTEKLAAHFGVSRRSIYRDVAALRSLDIQIEAVPGGGLLLANETLLPRFNLSSDQWSAVLLGLELVKSRNPGGLASAADDATRRLLTAMPASDRLAFEHSGLVSGPPSETTGPDLRSIMAKEVKANLTYSKPDGIVSRRRIWPVAIGFFDGADILAAWCELRAEWRHFRTDRIESIDALDQRLPRPRRILLADWKHWIEQTHGSKNDAG